MAIKRHKRGDRVYLSEYKQVREGNKVKSVFVRYLGPEDKLEAGEKPKRRVLDAWTSNAPIVPAMSAYYGVLPKILG